MVKTIIHGSGGHMGQVLVDLIAQDPDMEVVCGIDPSGSSGDFPVYKSISDCDISADVLIDFSAVTAMDALFDYCESHKLPGVICTTGLSELQLSRLSEVSKSVAMLRSANMSLGVNTLMDILEKFSYIFTDAGFDPEIVEMHHNRKLDAPSGTALALADSVKASVGRDMHYQYDRSTRSEKRPVDEIGIASLRGGTVVGEHEVIFAGLDEVVTFKHSAGSRAIFAKGALVAAKYLAGKAPGMYSMRDVISCG